LGLTNTHLHYSYPSGQFLPPSFFWESPSFSFTKGRKKKQNSSFGIGRLGKRLGPKNFQKQCRKSSFRKGLRAGQAWVGDRVGRLQVAFPVEGRQEEANWISVSTQKGTVEATLLS
jgi:hypothetical protein